VNADEVPYLGWIVIGVWAAFTLLGAAAQYGGGGKK